jgi:hypothetical protein
MRAAPPNLVAISGQYNGEAAPDALFGNASREAFPCK